MKKFIYLALIVTCFSCKKDNDTTNNSHDSNKEDTSKLNNQESNSLENQESSIEFGNLFNEGSQINFTPNDIESTKNNEIKEFGKKLKLYEKKYILEEGLDGSMLEDLINNSTSIGCNRYVNSSWLAYFLNKKTI
ncbi:hypothetical protein [Flavobacterium covae]|nr:hypothetical protein [Flavobacterium covae]AMA50568.1 hypothetical protein AWN65_14430 [Flavobacterium covae]MCJ1810314.1 hypothetical protein [Flavobacterium covae]